MSSMPERLATASAVELQAAADRLEKRIAEIRAGGISTPDSLRINQGALKRIQRELARRRGPRTRQPR